MDDFFKELKFPYSSLRKGQDLFINEVYSTISQCKNIMISAPTGLGKTVSALAPALHFAKKKGLSIIYLTSRQTQANQVIKTISDINKVSKENINYVAFIGKRSMCVHEERDLYPASDFNEFCKKMKEKGRCKYFKNTKNEEFAQKIKAIIDESSKSFLDVESFSSLAQSNSFCPYEIAGVKAFKADVIICDYNYMFTTGIRENFLGKVGRDLEDCIIIVDEAHNLPDRIRMSYSYVLSSEMIKNALKELSDFIKSRDYDNYIVSMREVLEEITYDKNLKENKEALISKDAVLEKYQYKLGKLKGVGDIIEELREIEAKVREDRIISHVGRFTNFLERWLDLNEEDYLRMVERYEKGSDVHLSFKIKCIDPSNISSDTLNKSYSSILMSGTLSPINMYKDILGVANTKLLELESPFPKENQKIIVVDDVTSKYSARGVDLYKKIAVLVTKALNSAPDKNAIVFFPSYDFMDRIVTQININEISDRKILREQKYMTKDEKEKFVNNFKDKGDWNRKARVLFGVTSGSFAEGLDLPEDMLEMVIVVGLPLSVPDLTINAVINHFEKKFRKGQLYGYIYPAMTKIIQAAGRCIRTENDRGVVILMDNRFLWPLYAQSFPIHWKLKKNNDFKFEVMNFFEE